MGHDVTTTERQPLIALVGPTAVGKTGASITLGKRLPIEIVNADSRSFYRGMDIGTAKATPEERAVIPHHLIDILEPDEPMSLAQFQDLALAAIRDIHRRGRVPMLVGGTPQYVNAIVEGWSIPRVEPNPAFRARKQAEAADRGIEALETELASVDPVAAERNRGNVRRIIRALEVHDATGRPITELQRKGVFAFHTLEMELWLEREALYSRIDQRIDDQVRQGLFAEVEGLLARGYTPGLSAFGSIGYRQIAPVFTGGQSREDAIARVKFDSHRLVRQQQTWFRRNPRLHRIDVGQDGWRERLMKVVESHLEQRGVQQHRLH